MRFFQNLLYIKKPSALTLIDITLLLAIIPHLFILKSFMLVYLLVTMWVIYKGLNNNKIVGILFGFGMLAIALSFFNNFNFSDLSKMQFFISLVGSLLIVAISLQRMTREINFYLIISPALLLILSFFFFDSITMLFYSLIVFFIFVLIGIWTRMDALLIDILKFTSALFLLSLPAVIVLFIFFPRISFEKADFGFRSDDFAGSGFSGTMLVSDRPFVPSERLIMEVLFQDKIPSEDKLYFRGTTLYPSESYLWEPGGYINHGEYLRDISDTLNYKVTFYPHHEKWLYPLSMQTTTPMKTELQKDYTLKTKEEVYKLKHFEFKSALEYKLFSKKTPNLLDYNVSAYPRTVEALQTLKDKEIETEQKAQELLSFFLGQKLAYSTNPKNLDKADVVDSFLFDAKNGYCTHFASSFAIAARIVGIPSRVVTGFRGDYKNMVENYLLIKQKNAHAWVELYLPKKGWVMYEPTASAYTNLDEHVERKKLVNNPIFHEINKQYMYFKFIITNWILEFDRLKQVKIFESLLNDTLYLLKFISYIFGVVVISVMLFYILRTWKKKDSFTRQTELLLKILRKRGLEKSENESMEQFLKRSERELNYPFDELNVLYHKLKYSKQKDGENLYESKIQELKNII